MKVNAIVLVKLDAVFDVDDKCADAIFIDGDCDDYSDEEFDRKCQASMDAAEKIEKQVRARFPDAASVNAVYIEDTYGNVMYDDQ